MNINYNDAQLVYVKMCTAQVISGRVYYFLSGLAEQGSLKHFLTKFSTWRISKFLKVKRRRLQKYCTYMLLFFRSNCKYQRRIWSLNIKKTQKDKTRGTRISLLEMWLCGNPSGVSKETYWIQTWRCQISLCTLWICCHYKKSSEETCWIQTWRSEISL